MVIIKNILEMMSGNESGHTWIRTWRVYRHIHNHMQYNFYVKVFRRAAPERVQQMDSMKMKQWDSTASHEKIQKTETI